MAKKVLMILLSVMLIASLTLISCSQEAKKPDPSDGPVVNKKGEVSENLLENGGFEDEDLDVQEDGSSIKVVEKEGVGSSKALFVEQTACYGEVLFDMTDFYGRGKSYYIEATFRNAGIEGVRTDDLTAKIDFNVVAGQAYEKTGRDYDVPGQYDGQWFEDGEEVFDIETDGEEGKLDAKGKDWVTLSAILDAVQIQELLEKETELCGGGDVTMYKLSVVFYVGTYQDEEKGEGPGQKGYKYYIDNIVIKDLNKELKVQGRTYKPEEGGDDEDEGDDE